MTNLNSREEIAKIDSKNMLGSLEKLGEQVLEINKLTNKFRLPASYKKINRAVGLWARILSAVFFLPL